MEAVTGDGCEHGVDLTASSAVKPHAIELPSSPPTSTHRLHRHRRRPQRRAGTLTIELLEDRLAPATLQFSSATFGVNEDAGTATITVLRTGGSMGAVTVDYATSDGTATAGSDYSATSGTLAFLDGQSSRTFSVPIIDDTLVEGNETVNLTLSNPTGGVKLGKPNIAVLTIVDNDPPAPTLGAHTLAYYEFPGPAGSLSTVPLTTQATGSTVLAWLGRGFINTFNSATRPIDNRGNSSVQIDSVHNYAPLYPDSGFTLYNFPSFAGGSGDIFSAPMPVGDELTLMIVEIKNGGSIQDLQYNRVETGNPQTTLSVTTTGPATLVTFWTGDSPSGGVSATTNNGFTVIDALLGGNNNAIQAAVATKDVAAAGTYDVTWTVTPAQTAFMYLVAVQRVALPKVTINDGAAQRSRVSQLTVTFGSHVEFSGLVANAFTLTRIGGGSVNFTAAASDVGGVTVATLGNFNGPEAEFGSLRDGRYTLTALAGQITVNGQPLDGDGDGMPGGNFVFGESQGLFRFFGDINGDRRVDIADFGLFSVSYLNAANYVAAFDFNGDGHIDIYDFGLFSLRYLAALP